MARSFKPLLSPSELEKLMALVLKCKKLKGSLRITAKEKNVFEESIIDAAAQAGISINKDHNLTYILDILEIDNFIPFEAFAPTAAVLNALHHP